MCGILGIVTSVGHQPAVSGEVLARAADLLAHRGPDGAGVWRDAHVALAHRRLSVIDASDAGAQPMIFEQGGARSGAALALVYNGELYNDAQLRAQLAEPVRARGSRFTTHCDTQTLGEAVLAWGSGACEKMRGMFAFGAVLLREQKLILARDVLGVKPLFYARARVQGVEHLAFASEMGALAEFLSALTGEPVRPDDAGVSAYLTTIRTSVGDRTMLAGVRSVRPGEVIEVDLGHEHLPARSRWIQRARTARGELVRDMQSAQELVRGALTDSVGAHLRSDVPLCTLLSGGLDSTIITALARQRVPNLRTFAAGADDGANAGAHAHTTDLAMARAVAHELGTSHSEALVSEGLFHARWASIVERLGQPLSTPNEVAIFEVASLLRASGCIVTLSGEGADELFAGYDTALDAAARWREGSLACAASRGAPPSRQARAVSGIGSTAPYDEHHEDPGLFELEHAAWVSPAWKEALLRPRAWRAAEHDAWLTNWYSEEFAREAASCADDHPLAPHMAWHRRINLTGLLGRLDTAAMLAGVEGRTPFADVRVLEVAEHIAFACKFAEAGEGDSALPRTKIALRNAFADLVPAGVLRRPKASFPLPFVQWLDGARSAMAQSTFVRSLLSAEAHALVCAAPSAQWRIAWPVANLALWAKRWGWTG